MLKQIEAAGSKPVTIEELKAHCRIDGSDEDAPLGIFLDSAIEFVSQRTGLALAPATYRNDSSDWWNCLFLCVAPVREITSISYLDENGASVAIDPNLYRWERTDEGAKIEFLSSFIRPSVAAERSDAVQVEFDAGFDDPAATGSGDDPALVLPSRAKQAILLIAAHWYQNRESALQEDLKIAPLAAESLLAQLRIYR
jgi:uncharacterized phiE125 gp8 family phage protein